MREWMLLECTERVASGDALRVDLILLGGGWEGSYDLHQAKKRGTLDKFRKLKTVAQKK